MGLFSSKKKVVVGTTVSRVVEDEGLPNAIKSGTIKAIFKNGEVPEYVLDELVTSMGMRADRMYNYAANHYTHGLPSGQFHSSAKGRAQAQVILDALEGAPVLIDYCNFGPPNSLHYGWMQIIALYGYNPATNELPVLSAQTGAPTYLHDMYVVVPKSQVDNYEAGSLDQWGTPATAGYTPERPTTSALAGSLRPHTPVLEDAAAADDYIRVEYVYAKTTSDWREEETSAFAKGFVQLGINPAMAMPEEDYFHVKYSVGGVTKYWVYRAGLGTHPTLDALLGVPPTVNGTYFPFIYFRFDKHSEIEDTSTQAYKTSKKCAKYLGMDYDLLAEAIDENPDIADVEQAMVIMAVPASTTDPLEQRYLFTFFDNLFYSQENQDYSPGLSSATGSGRLSNLLQAAVGKDRYTIVIEDKRFKMTLGYQELFKQQVAGNIGPVGSYASGTGEETYTYQTKDRATGSMVNRSAVHKYHWYRFQKRPGVYEELLVVGLRMQYYVEGSHKVTADETDDILLIPLDRSVTQAYSISERETLYTRSLHYVFNSLKIIKIKWYQTGIFKVLMLIVAVGVAIYDGGATLGAFLGLQGAAAIIATVVINLAIGELLQVAFKLFVKVFGADLALLAAIVLIAVGGYQMFQAGGVAGAPWADELLRVANGLQSAAMEAKYAGLMEDYSNFNSFMEEKNQLLETANELLDNRTALNPFVIFGESPNDYYNRTVHSGNIGLLGIAAVASYTEIALTLPKLNDTLGDSTYGY